MLNIGIRALSVAFPSTVRTNDYYRVHAPEVVSRAEERTLASVFRPDEDDPETRLMDSVMAPYLRDPFRGTVERRVLDPGQRSIDLGVDAVRRVLAAAEVDAAELDLLIVTSFMPHHIDTGDATWIAQALDLEAQVMNIEATCSGTMMALQTAAAMIASGMARRAVVASICSYSRTFDESDSLCWFMGDGAGAIMLEAGAAGEQIEAFEVINTRETCGAFQLDLEADADGVVHRYMRPGAISTSRALRGNAYRNLDGCTKRALAAAGLTLADIDAFVINTPVAWFREFAAKVWGIDEERIVSMHRQFANIGPALTTTNLYYSVEQGLLRPGDRALVYAFGSVSNATAAIMRVGDIRLAPAQNGVA